jgi:hypothetical protein
LNSTDIVFANKFKNIIYAVKNNSCQNLSCLMVIVVVIFVSFMYIRWAIVLTVNQYTYVKRPTFFISEWLDLVIFFIPFHVLVSFEELRETVTQKWFKHCGIKCCIGKGHNVLPVIQFSQHDPSTFLSFMFLGS